MAVATARSRSASSSTMKGSDPPSSRTVFFNSRPAREATSLPAASLPVSVTAAIRRSRRRSEDQRSGNQQALEKYPPGIPLAEQLLDSQGTPGTLDACFRMAACRHQRRRGKAEHCQKGKFQGITARIVPGACIGCSSGLRRTRASHRQGTALRSRIVLAVHAHFSISLPPRQLACPFRKS